MTILDTKESHSLLMVTAQRGDLLSRDLWWVRVPCVLPDHHSIYLMCLLSKNWIFLRHRGSSASLTSKPSFCNEGVGNWWHDFLLWSRHWGSSAEGVSHCASPPRAQWEGRCQEPATHEVKEARACGHVYGANAALGTREASGRGVVPGRAWAGMRVFRDIGPPFRGNPCMRTGRI